MKRVMVVGGPCSGKSTFARALGMLTSLPVRHIDLVHWMSNWQERSMPEKLPIMAEWEAEDRWIIEGGLSTTYANRAARADTIVWLDLAMGLRLWRLVKRRVQYHGQSRPDLPDNCPEKLTVEFLRYIVASNRRARARNAQLKTQAPHAEFHRLTSTGEIRAWLGSMSPMEQPKCR